MFCQSRAPGDLFGRSDRFAGLSRTAWPFDTHFASPQHSMTETQPSLRSFSPALVVTADDHRLLSIDAADPTGPRVSGRAQGVGTCRH